jgi:Cyclic nucleotide-binding domain
MGCGLSSLDSFHHSQHRSSGLRKNMREHDAIFRAVSLSIDCMRPICDALMMNELVQSQGLLDGDVIDVVRSMKVYRYHPDEFLLTRNERCDRLMVIVSGALSCHDETGAIQWFIEDSIQVLGEQAFFLGSVPNVSVKVVKEAVIYCIDQFHFFTLTARSYLRKMPMFNNLHVNDIETLLPYMKARVFDDGEVTLFIHNHRVPFAY